MGREEERGGRDSGKQGASEPNKSIRMWGGPGGEGGWTREGQTVTELGTKRAYGHGQR